MAAARRGRDRAGDRCGRGRAGAVHARARCRPLGAPPPLRARSAARAVAPRPLRAAAAPDGDGRPRAPAGRVRPARLRLDSRGRSKARSCGWPALARRPRPSSSGSRLPSSAPAAWPRIAPRRSSASCAAATSSACTTSPRRSSCSGSCRERGFGPWSCGVVCLEGLGRYDHGKVGDLALIKLVSALRGRWVEAAETADFVAPYGEWRGLATYYLMAGYSAGLVPGADRDGWRLPRQRAARAA